MLVLLACEVVVRRSRESDAVALNPASEPAFQVVRPSVVANSKSRAFGDAGAAIGS
jgi:hypothetical protein